MPSEINDVLQQHAARLMALPNVVSVGIGEKDGRPAILVGVTEQVPVEEPASEERIPETIDGHPVDVQVIGVPHIESPEEGAYG